MNYALYCQAIQVVFRSNHAEWLKIDINDFVDFNYKVSMYINFAYFLLIIPGIIFMHDGLFCRYYFFVLGGIYIYFYKFLKNKI